MQPKGAVFYCIGMAYRFWFDRVGFPRKVPRRKLVWCGREVGFVTAQVVVGIRNALVRLPLTMVMVRGSTLGGHPCKIARTGPAPDDGKDGQSQVVLKVLVRRKTGLCERSESIWLVTTRSKYPTVSKQPILELIIFFFCFDASQRHRRTERVTKLHRSKPKLNSIENDSLVIYVCFSCDILRLIRFSA